MARVNVFMTAENEHQSRSIGGRKANNFARARINTDTALGSFEWSLQVSVTGHGLNAQERRKRPGDQRKASAWLQLPEAGAAAASTSIGVPLPASIQRLLFGSLGWKEKLAEIGVDRDRAPVLLVERYLESLWNIHGGETSGRISGCFPHVVVFGIPLRHLLACTLVANYFGYTQGPEADVDALTQVPAETQTPRRRILTVADQD